MHDPTGRDGAASHHPGTPVPISAPAGPYAAAFERAAHATGTTVPWYNIPRELRDRPQWLLAAPDARGAYKVPMGCTFSSGLASGSVTNPATWLAFEWALDCAAHFGFGIGYVLSADDPFTCIDLDVKDDTTKDQFERFRRILYGFDTYTEWSQSGRGMHVWCRGKVGKGLRRDGVEVYSQERFIVCTGDVWVHRQIRDRQDMLNAMATQMRALGTAPAALVELPALESDYDHWQRKANASNGAKFKDLWFGRWEALSIGDSSQSCADLALMRMLCFNNPSNEQVRRLFRLSALGQRKKAARVDYVDGMIAEARAADAERARVHTQAAAAMAPGIEAELEAYRNRQRWSA